MTEAIIIPSKADMDGIWPLARRYFVSVPSSFGTDGFAGSKRRHI